MGSPAALAFGAFRLDPTQGLTRDGAEVRITHQALRVLWLLARRAGETVTKAELFRDAWPDTAVSDAALTSCIRELRRALQDDAADPQFIETRHRQGFRFLPRTTAVRGPEDLPSHPVVPDAGICVGRQSELARLASALRSAAAGTRQLAIIRGEAGIGKTTLVRAFLRDLSSDGSIVHVGGGCAEAIGGAEPYRPLLDAVATLCRASPTDRDGALLRRFAPTWWAHLPSLHGSDDRREPMPTGSVTTTRMSRELADYLEARAATHTLVVWVDDLHWADDGTLDWLTSFTSRIEPARVLVLATLRDEQRTRAHGVVVRLQIRPFCHVVALGGLDQHAVAEVVGRHATDAVDVASLAAALHTRTEGHPLFLSVLVDELTGASVGRAQTEPRSTLGASDEAGRRLPERLRDVLEAQIAQLDAGDVTLLEIASQSTTVIWSSALVAAAAQRSVLDVEEGLLRLARQRAFIEHAGPARWPDGTISEAFAFRHALHRDVLHERMPAHRRALVHRHMGARLAQAWGTHAHELASTLARHFEEAGEADQAVAYLLQAAHAANTLGTAEEAVRLLTRAVAVIRSQPPTAERDETEASLYVRLGAALMTARGWGAPEVERAFERAVDLGQYAGQGRQQFAVYWGLWLFRWGRGELVAAQALVARLEQAAGRAPDQMIRLQLQHAQWATAFCRGDLEAALAHADTGWALSRPDAVSEAMLAYGNHHAGACARAFAARALALLGRAPDARTAAAEAVTCARVCAHPFSLALTLVFASATHQVLRDTEAARCLADEAASISSEHGFGLLLAWAHALLGWSAREHQPDDAVRLVRDAVSSAAATGSGQFRTWLLGLRAATELGAGRAEDARRTVDEALAVAATTGERFNLHELQRLGREVLQLEG